MNSTGSRTVSDAAQQRCKQALSATVSKFVTGSLQPLHAGALLWPTGLATTQRRAKGRGCCRVLFRARDPGTGYLCKQLTRTQTSVLVVVKSGSLIIETGQSPLPVNAGDSAIIAPGLVRQTEIPAPYQVRVEYWALFFEPLFLDQFIRDRPVVQEIAGRVPPVFSGCYPQKKFLRQLRTAGVSDPTIDVGATFTVLVTGAWATVFMYLKEHYLTPRKKLERWVELHMASGRPVEEVAARFPGGAAMFRRDFRLAYGTSLKAWTEKKRKAMNRSHSKPASKGGTGGGTDAATRHEC